MYRWRLMAKGVKLFLLPLTAGPVQKYSGAWMMSLSVLRKIFTRLGLNPAPGKHIITLVDENGISISRQFEILEKEQR